MLLEILLVLPIYAVFFMFFWRFPSIIKAMEQLNDFLDEVDTPKEAVDMSNKREFLRNIVDSGQASKISGKKNGLLSV